MTTMIEGRRGGDDDGERARGSIGEDGMRVAATTAEEETMVGAREAQATVSSKGRKQEVRRWRV